MKFRDFVIDFDNAKSFIDRWSSFELTLEQFTQMLEESTVWHNVPIDILKTVAHFESGYPSRYAAMRGKVNPYRSNFRRPGSVFMGPFQEGDQYLAGIREQRRTKYYSWLTIPASTAQTSLGKQLYFMLAEKHRESHRRDGGYTMLDAPLNAGTLYALHVRPAPARRFLSNPGNWDKPIPQNVWSGQSSTVTAYYRATPANSFNVVRAAVGGGSSSSGSPSFSYF